MKSHQLINQDSGNTEIYTPPQILEAVRATMGWIDLDPASSEKANERVQAKNFFTETEDGLAQHWFGKVFMNHPFSRVGNKKWINKMVDEFDSFRVEEACCITFASTSEGWFLPLLKRPQCFLSPRTNYLLPDGTVYRGVTKGSVVTYFGQNLSMFAQSFRHLGEIKIPYIFTYTHHEEENQRTTLDGIYSQKRKAGSGEDGTGEGIHPLLEI